MTKKEIIESINKSLLGLGYKRKADTWYLYKSDFICVLNLQKSAWGNQYYINLCIYIKSNSGLEFPKEYQCHIRWRLTEETTNISGFNKSLDFEDDLTNIEGKLTMINKAISDIAIPIFSSLNTKEDLIKFIESKPKSLAVTIEGKKLLGISAE